MNEVIPRTRINFGKWLLRVVTWDGVVPFVLFVVPWVIRWRFPKFNLENDMFLLTIVPVAAFFVRLLIGLHYINTNHCPKLWQSRQQIALLAALFLMAYSDATMACYVIDPQSGRQEIPFLVLSLLFFAISLPCLIVAMYPGREPAPSTQLGNWEIEP